jgi:hypothetical protein
MCKVKIFAFRRRRRRRRSIWTFRLSVLFAEMSFKTLHRFRSYAPVQLCQLIDQSTCRFAPKFHDELHFYTSHYLRQTKCRLPHYYAST